MQVRKCEGNWCYRMSGALPRGCLVVFGEWDERRGCRLSEMGISNEKQRLWKDDQYSTGLINLITR